jgi:hypothetical protein
MTGRGGRDFHERSKDQSILDVRYPPFNVWQDRFLQWMFFR